MQVESSNNLCELISKLKALIYEYLAEFFEYPQSKCIQKNSKISNDILKYITVDNGIDSSYSSQRSHQGLLDSSSLSINNSTDSILSVNKFPLDTFSRNLSSTYSFNIGSVDVKTPVISAPMAGVSDNTYRIFARFFGSSLTFTEMISSYGIYYGHKKTLLLAHISDFERPCALQIFGSEPDVMAEASQRIEHIGDIIDINMGCPVPKVLKSKSGGYLLQDEKRVEKILSRIVNVVKKPVTLKTRIGWDNKSINILKIAKIAEASGVSAITIHGRTVKQGYSGKVDYEIIKRVKESVKIPVIANGDIDSPLKAKQILDYTGCDGIMIGRASRGSIWVFLNILLFLVLCYDSFYKEYVNKYVRDNFEEYSDKYMSDFIKDINNGVIMNQKLLFKNSFSPSLRWKKAYAKLYIEFLIYFKGEDRAVKEFRKILGWIFKNERGVSLLRKKFFEVKNYEEAVNVIESIGVY